MNLRLIGYAVGLALLVFIGGFIMKRTYDAGYASGYETRHLLCQKERAAMSEGNRRAIENAEKDFVKKSEEVEADIVRLDDLLRELEPNEKNVVSVPGCGVTLDGLRALDSLK